MMGADRAQNINIEGCSEGIEMVFPNEIELKRTLTIRVAFLILTKDINSALLLSQLYYWSHRTKNENGWIYKTQSELEKEIFLTPYQQRRARRLLLQLNLIEEKCIGLPKKLHFRINTNLSIQNIDNEDMKKLQVQVSRNRTNNHEKAPSISEETLPIEGNKLNYIDQETLSSTNIHEITTEITSKNTTKRANDSKSEEISSEMILKVFEHWKITMGHKNSKLDKNRSKLIREALKLGYSVTDLCQAVSGCSITPHNIGENDKGQRYDGLHIILKNADQIDRFMCNHQNPPVPKTKAEVTIQTNIGAAERWLSREKVSKNNGLS